MAGSETSSTGSSATTALRLPPALERPPRGEVGADTRRSGHHTGVQVICRRQATMKPEPGALSGGMPIGRVRCAPRGEAPIPADRPNQNGQRQRATTTEEPAVRRTRCRPSLHHQFRLQQPLRGAYCGTEVWTDAAGRSKDAQCSCRGLSADCTGIAGAATRHGARLWWCLHTTRSTSHGGEQE